MQEHATETETSLVCVSVYTSPRGKITKIKVAKLVRSSHNALKSVHYNREQQALQRSKNTVTKDGNKLRVNLAIFTCGHGV
jgi:hypothetical protein